MYKRIKIIVPVVAAMLVLSIVGGTAIVMAQDDETAPGVLDEELTDALKAALDNAVSEGLITQEQAAQIKERWEQAGGVRGRIGLGLMFKRMLGMDEEELDEYLEELIGEEKIDEEQAAQIKERWEQARGRIRLGLMFKRMLGMDEEELDEYLAELIGEEKIDEEQAAQIKERWDSRQETQDNVSLRGRVSRALRGGQILKLRRGIQQRLQLHEWAD